MIAVKELIKLLEECPQDLPVRLCIEYDRRRELGWEGWLDAVETNNTGDSGYEISGEIRLRGEQ